MGSTVAIAGESMASAEVKLAMLGDTVSTTVDPVMSTMVAGDVASMTIGTAMLMMVVDAVSSLMPMLMSMSVVDEAMSMSIGGAESMAVADDEPLTLVGVCGEIGDGW
jgi:hypothetical protein